MRKIPYQERLRTALLVLVIGGTGVTVEAQSVAPGALAPSGRDRSRGVRRVQATPADTAPTPTPPPAPGDEAAPTPPAVRTPETETDLNAPRAEKSGEPTEATAAAEAETAKEEPKPDVPLLAKFLGREEAAVKIYGWIQNSYTGNTNGQPKNRLNFGVNPNFLANSWMGNQYYLIFEKTVEQNDKINFGFRVDNLFGNDWQFNHMHGLFDTSFKLNHFNGYDPAQMYAEVHLPILTKGGVDIKGGRWYTLAGYEVVPATGRPLLSVPYMFNYGQPFTHFGMLSTWHVTDKLNVYNGAINGWDRWINETYKWGYIGGFNWTSKSGNTNLAWTLVFGPQSFPRFLPNSTQIFPTGYVNVPQFAGRVNPGYGGSDRTLFTTVLTHKWNTKLTQVVETDEAIEKNVFGVGPGGTTHNAEWYSLGNWFLYTFNDKLTGVWRSEVFRDNNGARTGFADNFFEITLGLIYKPHSWLWIRPEARYDWTQHTKPYNDGTRGSQFTLGVDVILVF